MSAKKTQEAMALAAEESAKSRAAKEVIKSLTAQVRFLVNLFLLKPDVFGGAYFQLVHFICNFVCMQYFILFVLVFV